MSYTISVPLKDLICLLIDLNYARKENFETHIVAIGEQIIEQSRGLKPLRGSILDIFGCDDALTMRSNYEHEYDMLRELFGTLLWKGDESSEKRKI